MPEPHAPGVPRLMLFFAIVYTVEGFCQVRTGVVWQPLTHYLKETLGWDAVRIAASLAVIDVPWVIKPLYGMISDFLPLFGYRRRPYLLLANAGAVGAFLWATGLLTPGPLIFALVLTSVAMAAASTVCGALLVENGQKHRISAALINQQWLWFYVAVMAAALLGGTLVEVFSPAAAMHTAFAIAAVVPVAAAASVWLVDEPRAAFRPEDMRRTAHGFAGTFRSRTIWLIAGFLFLYYLNPGLGTPLYFHMTDRLHFSQATIGLLSSVSAAGWIAGGLLYRYGLRGMTALGLLNLAIVAGAMATLSYLFMSGETSAVAIYFVTGAAGMLANIATLALAADHCPPRSEGFAFALLLSVTNLAAPLGDTIGALLFEEVFHRTLAPLIVISAIFTALILPVVPVLGRALKAQRV